MFENLSDYEVARLFVSATVYAAALEMTPDRAVAEAETLLDELGIVNPDIATTS